MESNECTKDREQPAQKESSTQQQAKTYLAFPKSNQTSLAILILPDIIGCESINIQLLADDFAARGYFVAVPDLFAGDALDYDDFRSGKVDLPTWLLKHTTADVDPIVDNVLTQLRQRYGVERIGAVGYCFGAKYAIRLLSANLISAGAGAHPSFVEEDELGAIRKPLLISAAETDHVFPAEKRHQSEEILRGLGVPYHVSLYSGVAHGFAVRADLSVRRARFAKEAAFSEQVRWFGEYVGKPPK
ncbi:hypothetical protein PRZ48_000087 [Zasmidium cellare]|uniref:Dienelactone hydrolase domain-containing protein n=1 Tax=Zasmidium cellare TaxID=395010 RepID=A0ABR0EXI4_ZASCE|nr:hypothetical protein PRZ48_000087 [Zasmidium cellare]